MKTTRSPDSVPVDAAREANSIELIESHDYHVGLSAYTTCYNMPWGCALSVSKLSVVVDPEAARGSHEFRHRELLNVLLAAYKEIARWCKRPAVSMAGCKSAMLVFQRAYLLRVPLCLLSPRLWSCVLFHAASSPACPFISNKLNSC